MLAAQLSIKNKNNMLDLSGFVKNDELVIDKENWSYIKENYEKDVVKQAISDIIKDLPLPMQKITYQDAINDFNKLVELDSQSLMCEGEWFTRYPCDYLSSDKYIEINKIGNQFSNHFQQKNRWKADSINAPSPERTWNTEKFRLTLLNGLWTQKTKEINNQTLRSCIALRKYIAAQFRPSAAKAIYEYFGAKNILDSSSGWADRLCGFMASEGPQHYCGVDPNTNLINGYNSQYQTYLDIVGNNAKTAKKYEHHVAAFEDLKLQYENYFCLMFSSCPYFLVEKYSADSSQSCHRYKKLDDWIEKFLYVYLKNSWKALKVGGHLALNISNVYMHHRINDLCNPANKYIKEVLGGEYIETIGYKMSKRPNSKSDNKGVFCEPIFIWQKVK